MNQRPLALALIVLTALMAGLSLSSCRGCEDKPDEILIRDMIDKAATLAEQHDIAGLLELATKGLKVDPGSHNRQSVKGILLLAFQQYGKFEVAHPRASIELDSVSGTATAKVPFLIIRDDKKMPQLGKLTEDPKAWLEQASEIADPYHLKLVLEKQDGEWKVAGAELHGMARVEY